MRCCLFVLLLLFHHPFHADLYFFHRRCVASQGTLYPKNIQFVMVDDIMVYYYLHDSVESSLPKWMNHSEGILLWREMTRNLKYNRYIMDNAVRITSKRFNHSHDHIYQAHGWCQWNEEDDSFSAAMGHAYDGKDFVNFHVPSRTWTAAVPEAVFYKRHREENIENLHDLIDAYESTCIRWLKKLVTFSAGERMEKVPETMLFESSSSPDSSREMVTCFATGFYPRALKIEWLNQTGHVMVDGVSGGEVLPNGDGTYQVRRSLKVPIGAEGSRVYRCIVQHSGLAGNLSLTWEPKRRLRIHVGCIGLIAVIAVLALIVFIKRVMLTKTNVKDLHTAGENVSVQQNHANDILTSALNTALQSDN